MTTDKVQDQIIAGIKARESGDYKNGLKLLEVAFKNSIKTEDAVTTIESANQLSIQYRLLAGRSNRNDERASARMFSSKSLEVYKILNNLGILNKNDPGIARNWAHSLLYAGKYTEAINALRSSINIQVNPAARGDEMCHLGSALINHGDIEAAKTLIEEGINLIKENNGSVVWLTYGLMSKATLNSYLQNTVDVVSNLNSALKIAIDNHLAVREEEIRYLMMQSVKVNVLEAVGSY